MTDKDFWRPDAMCSPSCDISASASKVSAGTQSGGMIRLIDFDLCHPMGTWEGKERDGKLETGPGVPDAGASANHEPLFWGTPDFVAPEVSMAHLFTL